VSDLVVQRPEGLYCPQGDFYIDPWRPVARAVITHAHSDHARVGNGHYLAAAPAEGVLRSRLGDITLQTLPYGERIVHHGVTVSLHPAGHVLGSAQVRLEHGGGVWVASGDYKVAPDPTCAPFEPVRCDVFITESTFGLPIYRWCPDDELFADINAWWARNASHARASVLCCYSFGKAQRVLSGVDPSIGPIIVHGAVRPLNEAYRAAGVALPDPQMVTEVKDKADLRRCMQVRGNRRRGGYDRGFVLSDHADWPGLLEAIAATGAQRVIVTHGSSAAMVRHLGERGLQAESFETEYGDDAVEADLQPSQEAT
jgi:putative mRNA 3-end processing factor